MKCIYLREPKHLTNISLNSKGLFFSYFKELGAEQSMVETVTAVLMGIQTLCLSALLFLTCFLPFSYLSSHDYKMPVETLELISLVPAERTVRDKGQRLLSIRLCL